MEERFQFKNGLCEFQFSGEGLCDNTAEYLGKHGVLGEILVCHEHSKYVVIRRKIEKSK